jgi:hypothetical protein
LEELFLEITPEPVAANNIKAVGYDRTTVIIARGRYLTLYGYDCVNEDPQNCLISVTWDIEISNFGQGTENILSVVLDIGLAPAGPRELPDEIIESINFGLPDIPFLLGVGQSLKLSYTTVADFCGDEVQYVGNFTATAETPNSGVPCEAPAKYCFNTDQTTFPRSIHNHKHHPHYCHDNSTILYFYEDGSWPISYCFLVTLLPPY